MHRRIARSFFILICGAMATVIGVLAALLFTTPGRHLLVRIVSDQSDRFLRGSLHIGGVSGTWLQGFTLSNVEIRDTTGEIFISAPRVRVRYQLANLLAGRFVLSEATLEQADMRIIKHRGTGGRSGRTNLEEIFRLGEGAGGGASPLVEIRNLAIRDTRVLIRLPWNPDGRLRTQRQVDSALAYEREHRGRRIEPGPEGLELIRTVEHATGFFPVVRLSTPDHQPITARIDRLAARVSDPALDLRDLRGTIRTKNDSLVFQAESIELPGTSGRGEGRLDWPRDTLLYRVSFTVPKLALADFRWISPQFPGFTGSGRVRGTSLSGSRTEFDIRDLVLRDATTRVNGRMVVITDLYRGLGFRGLNLTLEHLDLDVVRAYLDTLPFHGRVSGALEADGFFAGMTVALDWDFQDALVPGAASRVSLEGPLRFGGTDGLVFEGTRLRSSDVDLRTVRMISPSVTLNGRLAAEGTLTGQLRDVGFEGRAVHRDGEAPESRMSGRVRLDNRGAVLGIETDVVLDSLVFAGLRGSYPALSVRGSLGGRVKLAGTLEHLAVDADVEGALGQVRAQGGVTLFPPRWGADSLQLAFERLDLSVLANGAPRSRLTGRLSANGRMDSGSAPSGGFTVLVGPGQLAGFPLDSAEVRLHAAAGLINVDTMVAQWHGGRVDGAGSVGWAALDSGRLALHLEATDLTPLDSLALALTGFSRDTARDDSPLRGRGRGDLVLSGALPSLRLEGRVTFDSVRWLGYRGKTLAGQLTWDRGDSTLRATASADSLRVRRLLFTGLAAEVRGRPDSLRWSAELAGWGANVGRVGAGGRLQRLHVGTALEADSLNLDLLGRRWSLERPLRAVLDDQAISLDTVRLVTADGSGSVELAGNVPRQGAGELTVRALGIELRDLYGLAQRDTAGIAGVVAADGRINGTAREPELRGTATLTGGAFGDFHAPLIRGAFDYRERQLQGNVTFWRAGKPVVQADATVPVDLALAGAKTRQLPGPLTILARGDSIDLAILEAFTPNLRRVTGLMDVDARIEGTWDTPRLAGWVRLRDGAATVPGLGVRYQEIGGAIRLSGDSVLSDGLRLGGRFGELRIGGGLRLDRLTSPVLDLDLTARDFEVMDVPTFMSVRSSGEVRLAGTLQHPVLTGRGRIANSVIYFADLVQKEIVNLEDPLFADLVDTLALRRYSLGAAFQSRFLDSLVIRNLQLEIGEGVWLRSNEANFQLEGSVLINKTQYLGADQLMYRIVGDLNVPRGTYTLKAGGVINRTFTVERGTVRYFGDPNAVLDIQAQHIVRAPQRGTETIPVIAHITGTLEVPKLAVTTAPDQPPLSEPQLISLLTVGSTDPLAVGPVQQQAFVAAANALASELQRALISDPNSPVDILEIRPGVTSGGAVGQGGVATQLAVGRALTERLFVTANAGFCLVGGTAGFNARNLGATLEYRFRPDLRGQISAEPVQTCQRRGVDIFGTARRYQFGAELRWDRDF